MTFRLPPTNALEISAELTLGSAESIELSLQNEGDKTAPIIMHLSATEFTMPDTRAALDPAKKPGEVKLRLFIDRSVLEIFVNQTVCATKTIAPSVMPPCCACAGRRGTG